MTTYTCTRGFSRAARPRGSTGAGQQPARKYNSDGQRERDMRARREGFAETGPGSGGPRSEEHEREQDGDGEKEYLPCETGNLDWRCCKLLPYRIGTIL